MFLEKHLWSKVILEKFQQKDGDKFTKMSDKMKYKKDLFMGGKCKTWNRKKQTEMPGTVRSSCPEMFCKTDVFKNFAKFPKEHL